MNISLDQAIIIAKHQKDLGCCSANAQAIVLLYDEIERQKQEIDKLRETLASAQDVIFATNPDYIYAIGHAPKI